MYNFLLRKTQDIVKIVKKPTGKWKICVYGYILYPDTSFKFLFEIQYQLDTWQTVKEHTETFEPIIRWLFDYGILDLNINSATKNLLTKGIRNDVITNN